MKFPRTPHLPGSKATPDDLWANLPNLDNYIATEKMDGSNIMMNNKKFITRKGSTSTADWVYPARNLQAQIAHLIPQGIWIAGELLTWRKSIAYEDLPNDYMVFGAMKGNQCLAWDDVLEIADKVNLPTVNVLAGPGFVDEIVKTAKKGMSETMEGFVIRPTGSFQLPHYGEHVAKFVGSHHTPVAGSNGKNGILR